MHPPAKSWFDFDEFGEVYTEDSAGNSTFKCTLFKITSDHRIFYGEIGLPQREISLEQANASLTLIPMEKVYPKRTVKCSQLKLPHGTNVDDVHIKRPKFYYDMMFRMTEDMTARFLAEVEVLEFLRTHPHPDIAEYYGCIFQDDFVVGLAFRRYPETLRQAFDANNTHFAASKKASWLHTIRATIDHLHSLGYAHNDVNPHNIMLNEQGETILIDLGSCQRFGEALRETGTRGWNEGFDTCSSRTNDLFGLAKLQEWLGL